MRLLPFFTEGGTKSVSHVESPYKSDGREKVHTYCARESTAVGGKPGIGEYGNNSNIDEAEDDVATYAAYYPCCSF